MHQADGAPQIVFAVCHPDDEALWIGGLIAALSRSSLATVRVVCLSGADPSSPRVAEFEAARAVAGYAGGVIVGGPLRSALDPLPDIGTTLESGLEKLGVTPGSIDLLITHSPFGDEHKHPHHRQANRELRAWARARGVPYGYFSCLPIPWFTHRPLLTGLRRQGALHLLNLSRCAPARGRLARELNLSLRAFRDVPAYYLQFQIAAEAKRAMLDCYRSIDLPAHEAGYASFTTFCESLYVMDRRGLAVLERIVGRMPHPGPADLFDVRSNVSRVLAGVGRLLGKGERG